MEALSAADPAFTAALHAALRERGVLAMPFPFGRVYLSFAHGPAEIAAMGEAYAAAAHAMAGSAAT